MKSIDLATLNKELRKQNECLAEANAAINSANATIRRCKAKIKQLKSKISKKQKTKVTDHAMIRYLERVVGLNIKELEETILNSKECELVVRDGIVITVKTKNES